MALNKAILQEDGVTTNYHRILFLQTTVNRQNSIAVLSYVSEEARRNSTNGARPYAAAVTYECPYDENMTIESAYDYLKTLPEFEGAEDVYENSSEEDVPTEEEQITDIQE